MKFDDLDADGVKDAGEPGLAGWTIYARPTATTASRTPAEPSTTTDADGDYTITGPQPRHDYIVCEARSRPAGPVVPERRRLLLHDGAGAGDWAITLTSGQTDTGNDFGNWTARPPRPA